MTFEDAVDVIINKAPRSMCANDVPPYVKDSWIVAVSPEVLKAFLRGAPPMRGISILPQEKHEECRSLVFDLGAWGRLCAERASFTKE